MVDAPPPTAEAMAVVTQRSFGGLFDERLGLSPPTRSIAALRVRHAGAHARIASLTLSSRTPESSRSGSGSGSRFPFFEDSTAVCIERLEGCILRRDMSTACKEIGILWRAIAEADEGHSGCRDTAEVSERQKVRKALVLLGLPQVLVRLIHSSFHDATTEEEEEEEEGEEEDGVVKRGRGSSRGRRGTGLGGGGRGERSATFGSPTTSNQGGDDASLFGEEEEDEGDGHLLSAHNEALALLRELACTVKGLAEELASQQGLVARVIELMMYRNTFLNAVVMAEEILLATEDTFDLEQEVGLELLQRLIDGFNPTKLAVFCRILAILVVEPEVPPVADPKKLEHARTKQERRLRAAEREGESSSKMPPSPHHQMMQTPRETRLSKDNLVRDSNHRLVLQCPGILDKFIALLKCQLLPRLQGTNTDNMTLHYLMHIRNEVGRGHQLSDMGLLGGVNPSSNNPHQSAGGDSFLYETSPSFFDSEFSDGDSWATESSDMQGVFGDAFGILDGVDLLLHSSPQETSMAIMTHFVEVLYVCCALCGGVARTSVQDKLAELGVVQILTTLFDQIDWTASPVQDDIFSDLPREYGCTCHPATALKIQALRLIHNFCDRDCSNDLNKNSLLSESEFNSTHYAIICKEPMSLGTFREFEKMNHRDHGLLFHIMKVMLQEAADGAYTYWLASCIEVFLRGSDSAHQRFVAQSGIVQHILDLITKGGDKSSTFLQITFDLLGEIIKYNGEMITMVSDHLESGLLDSFLEITVTRLIEANVFLRSVILSVEDMKHADECSTISHGSQAGGKLAEFVRKNELRLLRSLMMAVRPEELDQENVCIINTALVQLMFMRRRGELGEALQFLRQSTANDDFIVREAGGERSGCTDSGKEMLYNFRIMLDLWRDYYSARPRDCECLQYSSRIPFQEWDTVITELCGSRESITSLEYRVV